MSEDASEILIDKLKQYCAKPNDNVETVRQLSLRLHSRVLSLDKSSREKVLEKIRKKKTETLPMLLSLLEAVRDIQTAASLAGILHECITPKSGPSRAAAMRCLLELNATSTIVKLIQAVLLREPQAADPLLQELVWIASQLALKDNKFAAKVRLMVAVKAFHSLLRTYYYNHNKMLFPMLLILRALSKNPTSVAILSKDGIAATLEKAFIGIGFAPNIKMKLLIGILADFSRNSRFCARMVKAGVVHMLMKMFERWERFDGKIRHKICSYSLITLQRVATIQAGRIAIRSASGFGTLLKFGSWCPNDKVYDMLLSRACTVINLCLERKALPIKSPDSPARFLLPQSVCVDTQVAEPDSDDSDDEAEVDTEDAAVGDEGEGEDVSEKKQLSSSPSPSNTQLQFQRRDLLELKMYARDFQEYQLQKGPTKSPGYSYFPLRLKTRDNNDLVTCPGEKPNPDPLQLTPAWENREPASLTVLANLPSSTMRRAVYSALASRTNSILPFIKVAYPDMLGGEGIGVLLPLNVKDRKICRHKVLTSIERVLHPEHMLSIVAYDLDQLLLQPHYEPSLTNCDEGRLGVKECQHQRLVFESRFESGNLRKAIQISGSEYDLIITPDVNSSEHNHWFYFEVSNMESGVPYTFNIVNCEKTTSQYNEGMKPILYSVKEAVVGRPGWVRTGTDLCYFRNSFNNPKEHKGAPKRRRINFFTATFTVKFVHSLDVCYIAYLYPYTYTQLMTQIYIMMANVDAKKIYFRADNLCNSLNRNQVPVLTITAPESRSNPIEDRELVVLTSRVHPGESNASWMMQGSLLYLVSDALSAERVRQHYVFKIIPMLNTEGVINGCYRCGLTNEDLNRHWSRPDPVLHPVIFHTKGLLEYYVRVMGKSPYVFCDYHGHSRRKNVFLYGCSNSESWALVDRDQPNIPLQYLMLPHLMASCCPSFDLLQCKFSVERNRESTARVTVWREYGVHRSYTMESSTCGCDQGIYKGHHLDTHHIKEIGSTFCIALGSLFEETKWRLEMMFGSHEMNRESSVRKTSFEDSSSLEDSDDIADDAETFGVTAI